MTPPKMRPACARIRIGLAAALATATVAGAPGPATQAGPDPAAGQDFVLSTFRPTAPSRDE